MAGEDTDFWLALSTIGPVMFLALGALAVEPVRERGLGWKRPAQKVQLIAINVSFLGTLLATVTAVLSLAWRSNLLPPKVLGVVRRRRHTSRFGSHRDPRWESWRIDP